MTESEIKKILDTYLNYYKEFKNNLYLLMKQYDNMKEIEMAFYKVCGKVDLLEDLKREIENKIKILTLEG